MRNKTIIYHLFYILYIWLICYEIKGTNGEEYKIKNDKSSYNLLKIINSNDSLEPLLLKFEDSVYEIEKFDSSTELLINVRRNITFTGTENGTIFRIKEEKKTYFHLQKSTSNEKYSFIKFENIIFENYGKSEFYNLLYSEIQKENQYQLIVDNCSFKNLNNVIFISYDFENPLYKEHLIINDSSFQ